MKRRDFLGSSCPTNCGHISQNALDRPALYRIYRDLGGATWIVVEQEGYPGVSQPDGLCQLESIALSKDRLDKSWASLKN